MSELDPKAFVTTQNGERFEINRRNASLYTFMGKVILRDVEIDADRFSHVFIETTYDDDNDIAQGLYIHKEQPSFEPLEEFMIKNDFQMHLNLHRVSPGDVKAYMNFLDAKAQIELGDMGDFIPENWQ